MIKIENVVLASPEQMEFIIQGMRNPMNSWEKSDTNIDPDLYSLENIEIGENDLGLMQRLSNAGTEHRKYMRMMPVYVRITAPLYWWKEFDDTYKVGIVANSCSTMHKIAEKEFTLEDFSTEHLLGDEVGGWEHPGKSTYGLMWDIVSKLNECRELYLKTKSKTDWWQLIQLLPSSYNQTRNVMLNYEVLANIYRQRKNHKLVEWRAFCKWIKTLPYQKLITGEEVTMCDDCKKQYEECHCDCTREYEKIDEIQKAQMFGQPFPWINEDDVYCNNCEHFHNCLKKGGLVDVTTSDDIVRNCFGQQRYINKPGYDCPKEKIDNTSGDED